MVRARKGFIGGKRIWDHPELIEQPENPYANPDPDRNVIAPWLPPLVPEDDMRDPPDTEARRNGYIRPRDISPLSNGEAPPRVARVPLSEIPASVGDEAVFFDDDGNDGYIYQMVSRNANDGIWIYQSPRDRSDEWRPEPPSNRRRTGSGVLKKKKTKGGRKIKGGKKFFGEADIDIPDNLGPPEDASEWYDTPKATWLAMYRDDPAGTMELIKETTMAEKYDRLREKQELLSKKRKENLRTRVTIANQMRWIMEEVHDMQNQIKKHPELASVYRPVILDYLKQVQAMVPDDIQQRRSRETLLMKLKRWLRTTFSG